MAEQAQQFNRDNVPYVKGNGVRVEFWPDGTTMIFGDPQLSFKFERESPTQSGHLTTMIIFKRPQVSQGLPPSGPTHSRPTETSLK